MNSKPWSRIWGGALCAILASWLALVFWCWLALSWVVSDSPGAIPDFDIGWATVPLAIGTIIIIVAITFIVLSFIAGMICAFFWHPIASVTDYERWGFWVWLLAVVPTMFLFGLGLLVFLPSLVTFYKSLDFGVQWWAQHRYLHFFGQSNDWERDDKS